MILSAPLDTPGTENGHEDGKIVTSNLSEEIIENNIENDKTEERENEDNEVNEEESDARNMPTLEEPRTRCGRVARNPTRHPHVNAEVNGIVHDCMSNMKEMIIMNVDSESSTFSPNMLLVHETGLIGAVISRGFENSSELRPMKHKNNINGTDKEKWVKEIDE